MALILFSGSRDVPLDKEDTLKEDIKSHLSCLDQKTTVVLHGGAKGVDSLVDEVAKSLGFTVKKEEAQWDKYGGVAGPIRNKKMIDMRPDKLIAYPAQNSRGTTNTIDLAKKAEIPTIISNILM